MSSGSRVRSPAEAVPAAAGWPAAQSRSLPAASSSCARPGPGLPCVAPALQQHLCLLRQQVGRLAEAVSVRAVNKQKQHPTETTNLGKITR